jgi:3-phenylpropionate/trans-cinnamate dioxygenase ferredoxin reductase component
MAVSLWRPEYVRCKDVAAIIPERSCRQARGNRAENRSQSKGHVVDAGQTFLIVGASMAGAKAAEALRDQGFGDRIVLVGDEQHPPYERPPLSKDYLAGNAEKDSAAVHGRDWYAEHNVELRLGTAVTRLDPAAHRVSLADGNALEYTKLLLATGAAPRALPLPGADADGVYMLRRFEDSDRIKQALPSAGRLVVIGAGWIGLEVAAVARQAGVDVTVVETAALPLLNALGPEAAEIFAGLHREHGVDFRFGSQVAEITTDGSKVTGVRLTDGTTSPAGAVLVAVGVEPNAGLAREAGLTVDNGIVVDAALRTSDPDVFAAGDVANAFHPLLRRQIRVEHWANALSQPATAAASMLGKDASYEELPYFFTDQYDLGMEYTGYVEPGGYDQVVFRGDTAAREFIAFWLRDNRVLAGMNVNVWDVTEQIKTLVLSGASVDPARLADPDTPLDDLVAG